MLNNSKITNEKIFEKIDYLIEKWSKETGKNKTLLFGSGIISSNGYYQGLSKQSLRINTLIDIANFFDKSFLDFFINENNLLASRIEVVRDKLKGLPATFGKK